MEGNRKLFRAVIAGAAMVWMPLLIWSAPWARAEAPAEREVVVSISDAFIPSGFDVNSESYVVVNGLYPNGCYRWKAAAVASDETGLTHEVRSLATVRSGMCLTVLVPFTQEVKLGKLRAGDHAVRFMNGDGTYLEKHLVVQ